MRARRHAAVGRSQALTEVPTVVLTPEVQAGEGQRLQPRILGRLATLTASIARRKGPRPLAVVRGSATAAALRAVPATAATALRRAAVSAGRTPSEVSGSRHPELARGVRRRGVTVVDPVRRGTVGSPGRRVEPAVHVR